MINPGVMSSKKLDYETPPWLFRLLDAEFQFDVDVAATAENALCPMFYTPEVDGLKQRWMGTCFLNPPYGRAVPKWIKKAFESALCGDATVVCLVAARTDTRWFWDYCRRGEIRFLKGRLHFGDAGPAPFPSAVVIFRAGNIQGRSIWWEIEK